MTSATPTLRRFLLVRSEDVSGTSGTGIVAEGVEWSDGTCGVHWLSQLACWSTYSSMKTVEEVHGHDGKTVVQWVDEPGAAI